MKPTKILAEMALEDLRQKHPKMPEHALPQPKFKFSTANGLTQAIIKFLELSGHQAERINTMGRRIDTRKSHITSTGFRGQVGSVKWIPGTGTKGSADISAIISGRSVKIEVKIKRDVQSENQKVYQANVEMAGGIYIIAKTFDEFYEWYQYFINQIK